MPPRAVSPGLSTTAASALFVPLPGTPRTISSSTATLATTDVNVEVTVAVTALTLASAAACTAGLVVRVHNATARACLIQLVRAGSDTIDAATARAGLVPPGQTIIITLTSTTTWTSTLSIDPRPAMSFFEWRPDASSGNLSEVGSGWTQNGTAGAASIGGVLYATESRAGSTLKTGWEHGSRFFLSDGRPAFYLRLYNTAPTSNQHRWMAGLVSGFFSGTRGTLGAEKVIAFQYEAGDTNWQFLVRDSANSVHDTGSPLAAGHYSMLFYRDGSVARWIIYYSATDATFAGVTPVVGSATPSAWPSATTLQAQLNAAAGASWTGTLGAAGVAYGEVL